MLSIYDPKTKKVKTYTKVRDEQKDREYAVSKGLVPVKKMTHPEKGTKWLAEDILQDSINKGWLTVESAKFALPQAAKNLLEEQDELLSLVPEAAKDFASAFLDMASAGFADEAIAGIQTGLAKLKGKDSASYELYKDTLEQIRDLRKERSPIAYTAGSVAGALGPGALVTRGAALPNIGRLAALEGVTGAGLSKEKDVAGITKDMMIGAAIGAAAGGVGEGLSKAFKHFKQAPEDLIEDSLITKAVAASDADSTHSLYRQMFNKEELTSLSDAQLQVSKNIQTEASKAGIFTDIKDLQKWTNQKLQKDYDVLLKEVHELVDDPTSTDFTSYLAVKKGQELLPDEVTSSLSSFGLPPKQAKNVKSVANSFLDSQYVYAAVDDKLGTELMPHLNELSRAYNKYTTALSVVTNNIKKSKNLDKTAKELGKQFGFKDPSAVVDPLEYVKIIQDATKGKDISELFANKELVESVRLLFKDAAKDEQAFGFGLSKLYDTEAVSKINAVASSLDNYKIPNLIQEQDQAKKILKYSMSELRSSLLKDPTSRFRMQAEVLRGKDSFAYDYAKRHVQNIMNAESGIVRRLLDHRHLTENIKRVKEGKKPKSVNVADFVDALGAQMYPYYLGLRVDAPIRNMLQPYLLTARSGPDMAYLFKKAIDGTIYNLKTKGLTDDLARAGFTPPKFKGETNEILVNGLKSGLDSKLKRVGDSLGDAAMHFYSKSDIVNRKTTYGMGVSIAKDFLAGSPKAANYIRSMPRSYKNRVLQAKKTDPDKVQDIIADYLLSTTQFNYNKVALSEYGRFAGSAFSAFTKWPTSILGDVAYNYSRGNKTHFLAKKYLYPMAAAQMVEASLVDYRKENPEFGAIMGKNFANWAPGASLGAFYDYSLLRPPGGTQLIRSAKQTAAGVKKLAEGDEEGLSTIRRANQIYLPYKLGGYSKLFFDKLPEVGVYD